KGKFIELGVEIDGNQQAHIHGLETLMAKRGVWYSFAKQIGAPATRKGILNRASGVKKHERFKIISPRFLQRKIWLPEHLRDTPDMQEFISQVKGATHEAFTRADDGPDLVSMLGEIDYILPTAAVPTSSGKSKGDIGYDPFWDDDDSSHKIISASAGYA
ncbi:MAG: hypothetical protein U9R42_06160, partial [Bacteroidota bacterium]|nr:hypothetical protein [Bacteroidota bacterium]